MKKKKIVKETEATTDGSHAHITMLAECIHMSMQKNKRRDWMQQENRIHCK